MSSQLVDFAILGAGAMGTAMGYQLACNGNNVLLWGRRKSICDQINKKKENSEYMPMLALPENLSATTDLEECVSSADKIVIAVPSHAISDLFTKLSGYVSSETAWLSIVKGMDLKTRSTVSQLLRERLHTKENRISVLSGPTFATEFVRKVPTIAVIGSKSIDTAFIFRRALMNDYFLIETTNDLNGVEVGGILKNIGAIAIGLIDGLNLGDNTRGFVFSIYVRELLEVGTKVFDAKVDTLLGPACLGDMVTTAFSEKSRNRALGLLAAKSITKIPEHTFISEGRNNVEIVKEFANQQRIEVPVTQFVYDVLKGTKSPIAFRLFLKRVKG